MKKTVLFCFIFSSIFSFLQAQELVPFGNQLSRRPVSNIDTKRDFIITKKYNIPGLTEEQTEKMSEFKLKEKKQLLKIKNQLAEKKARLHSLQTADKPDMKEIYKNIDEIAGLIAQEMKIKSDCIQQIRATLTEEQRIDFDLNLEERKLNKSNFPK